MPSMKKVTPGRQVLCVSIYEMEAICSKLSKSSGHIDAQDIEILGSVLKDFAEAGKNLDVCCGCKISVWRKLAKKNLKNRKRAVTLENRMKGVKKAMDKVEQDWHVLNTDGGIGKGTTAYADWELTEMEDNLEGLERAARKKRRIG